MRLRKHIENEDSNHITELIHAVLTVAATVHTE
jgi:hypothetical protein